MLVFTVPMAHFRGIPTALRERFGIPVVFYDGDVPMSLPEFGGMDTGFNYYHGADPSEYDLVLSNSEGGLDAPARARRAARRGRLLGRRPRVLRPQPVEKEMDVFFYGYGDKFRREWMAATGRRAEPPRAADRLRARRPRLPGRRRARARARRRAVQRLRARDLGGADQPQHHAPLARDRAGSSTCRPFELAAAGAAIVSNPHAGIERWFEPGSELLVVDDADAALAAYRELLDDPAQAEAMGARARERVLDEHTYRTAPAGCSARRPRDARWPVHEPSHRRDRARVQRGGRDRRRRRGDPRLRPGIDVLVVDDASTDDTAAAAAAAGAAVVRLPFNLGIGGAVQTGFRYALERGYEVAVRLDGDGQHDPAELAEAARAARARRGRRRHRLAVRRRRRAATGRRSAAGSGSSGSRGSSRCSPAGA